MIRFVVFDCDGTLVDSQATIVACARAAFLECGVEPPEPAAIRHIVGLSLEPAMKVLLRRDDPAMAHRIAGAYKAHFHEYRARPEFDEPLFEGVREVLDGLARRHVLMGVATGKSRPGLDAVIAHHDLDGYFVTLQTADRHPSKPHPAMLHAAMAEAGAESEETVIVGDTSFDIEMGRAANCGAIAVTYGNHTAQALRAAGAHALIDAMAELDDVLAGWNR